MSTTVQPAVTAVLPSREQLVRAAQERAEQAEQSPYPVVLRAARALAWVVTAVVTATAGLLALAFVLRLGGANPDAGFSRWVERSVARAMDPFRGIFPERPLTDSSVFDASVLFAAAVYAAVAVAVGLAVRALGQRLQREQREAADLRAAADRAVEEALADRRVAEQQRAVQVVVPPPHTELVNGSAFR